MCDLVSPNDGFRNRAKNTINKFALSFSKKMIILIGRRKMVSYIVSIFFIEFLLIVLKLRRHVQWITNGSEAR